MSNPVPEPIEFTRVVWRDKDLAQSGDPYLEAQKLNRYEVILEQIVEKVNNTSGMVTQMAFENAVAALFPLLPELTNQPTTNPIANSDDLKDHTTRYHLTSSKEQYLPSAVSGDIVCLTVTRESSGSLTIRAAGTNRIGFGADVSLILKPSDYVVLRAVLINNVVRWFRLTGPLLSETDSRYTLPGDTGFTQADADELYEKVGTAANLVSQISKASVGLSQVQNYSPADMPISDDTQAALNELAIAPPKVWNEDDVQGNYRPDYEDGPSQSAEIIGDTTLLAPANPRDQCAIRLEFFNSSFAAKKLSLDPNIVNVSLVPFPASLPNYRSTIAMLIWSTRGNRWLLTTFIPEP